MARFNFKSQLKGKSLVWLKEFKEEITYTMISLSTSGHKDAQKYNRYISYIDEAINKLK